MDLHENIERINQVMGTLIKEQSDPELVNSFENVLNSKLPKKFPWWENIEIKGFHTTKPWSEKYNTISFDGDLKVNDDWIKKQWKKKYQTISFYDASLLELPEVLDLEEYFNLKKEILKYYNAVFGDIADNVRLHSLILKINT